MNELQYQLIIGHSPERHHYQPVFCGSGNAVLLTTGGIIQVGNLNAGGSFEVDQLLTEFRLARLTIPMDQVCQVGFTANCRCAGGTVEQILGTYDYYQNRELFRKYALLTAVLGYSPANLQRKNEVYLLGWSDQTVVDIDIADKKETFDDITLYIASMQPEIDFEGDTWTLSPGFFQWASIDPLRTDISPYNVYLYTPTSYGLVFSPGYALEFSEVVSLTFHLLNPYQTGAGVQPPFRYGISKHRIGRSWITWWGDNQIEAPLVLWLTNLDQMSRYLPSGDNSLNVQTSSGYMEIILQTSPWSFHGKGAYLWLRL
jgi:hypothetical protein